MIIIACCYCYMQTNKQESILGKYNNNAIKNYCRNKKANTQKKRNKGFSQFLVNQNVDSSLSLKGIKNDNQQLISIKMDACNCEHQEEKKKKKKKARIGRNIFTLLTIIIVIIIVMIIIMIIMRGGGRINRFKQSTDNNVYHHVCLNITIHNQLLNCVQLHNTLNPIRKSCIIKNKIVK